MRRNKRYHKIETKINPHIENTLGDTVDKKNFLKYFGTEVEKIYKEFSKVTRIKLLEYQELMNEEIYDIQMLTR